LQGILILVAVATDNVIMNRLRSLWTRSGLRVESNEEGSHGA
jgi:hypothetical protein